ncbi:hypothetical protein JKP88DRAFT_282276 [Tribonema minus]|uniref:Uncharacterized protein n=1 Tax=Tribonema minus TaxID=303371 RepID=A0A835YTY6_9STRA|nr:hypothetical protein JKP88DRAFT_282276 [Tribonema minus]
MMDPIALAHPAMLAVDLAVAQAWWSLTVPPLKVLRTLGIGRAKLPKADLTGKVCIVTGANRGVGARTALHLAEMGATIVLACRRGQANAAKTGIIEELRAKKVEVDLNNIKPMELDLLSMQSVRDFADAFKRDFKRLDILVNNAGVSEPGVTSEGYSITFTTNHIGHYLLTDLLYPETDNARIVNVASVFHQYGDPDKWEEAATGRRGDTGPFDVLTHVYADSKLANLMHALDLRRRFTADRCNAVAFAVHPGNCRTDLWRYVPNNLHNAFDKFMRIFFLSPELGCYTSVSAAVAPLDRLREPDGNLARFLQPYWCPVPYVKDRAAHQIGPFAGCQVIGPFAGCQVGTASLPNDVDGALDTLRRVSEQLVADISKKQETHTQADPAAVKAIHPVAATEYPSLAPRDVPIRF